MHNPAAGGGVPAPYGVPVPMAAHHPPPHGAAPPPGFMQHPGRPPLMVPMHPPPHGGVPFHPGGHQMAPIPSPIYGGGMGGYNPGPPPQQHHQPYLNVHPQMNPMSYPRRSGGGAYPPAPTQRRSSGGGPPRSPVKRTPEQQEEFDEQEARHVLCALIRLTKELKLEAQKAKAAVKDAKKHIVAGAAEEPSSTKQNVETPEVRAGARAESAVGETKEDAEEPVGAGADADGAVKKEDGATGRKKTTEDGGGQTGDANESAAGAEEAGAIKEADEKMPPSADAAAAAAEATDLAPVEQGEPDAIKKEDALAEADVDVSEETVDLGDVSDIEDFMEDPGPPQEQYWQHGYTSSNQPYAGFNPQYQHDPNLYAHPPQPGFPMNGVGGPVPLVPPAPLYGGPGTMTMLHPGAGPGAPSQRVPQPYIPPGQGAAPGLGPAQQQMLQKQLQAAVDHNASLAATQRRDGGKGKEAGRRGDRDRDPRGGKTNKGPPAVGNIFAQFDDTPTPKNEVLISSKGGNRFGPPGETEPDERAELGSRGERAKASRGDSRRRDGGKDKDKNRRDHDRQRRDRGERPIRGRDRDTRRDERDRGADRRRTDDRGAAAPDDHRSDRAGGAERSDLHRDRPAGQRGVPSNYRGERRDEPMGSGREADRGDRDRNHSQRNRGYEDRRERDDRRDHRDDRRRDRR